MDESLLLPVSMESLRPRTLREIIGQREVVQRLTHLAEAARAGHVVPPNLLFHGPPGIGKTTAARAFAREVLGEEWENSFHQLASYDDRGVHTISHRIIPDSRRRPSRSAPFRILFLDDADGLSAKSQNALRPGLEGEGSTSQFILACNDLRKISPPLRSRCTVLEFTGLTPQEIRRVLDEALAKTDFTVPPESLEALIERSGGIPREALKLLIEEDLSANPWEYDPRRSDLGTAAAAEGDPTPFQ